MRNALRQNSCSRRTNRRPGGFTLIEVAMAIIVVGVGSLAMMQLSAVCTMQNRAASQTTTAAMLAQHVQEMLATLTFNDPAFGSATFGAEIGETLATYDDLDDFDGVTFSTPIDSTRTPLTGFTGYSQKVTVMPVSGKQLSSNQSGTAITKTTYTGAVRIRVEIQRTMPPSNSASTVYTLEWIRVED